MSIRETGTYAVPRCEHRGLATAYALADRLQAQRGSIDGRPSRGSLRRRTLWDRFAADTSDLIRPALSIKLISRRPSCEASNEIYRLSRRGWRLTRPLLRERIQVKRSEPHHSGGRGG